MNANTAASTPAAVREKGLRSGLLRGIEPEHLPQVREVARVLADGLARRIRDLGDGLAVALGHLQHDVDRLVAEVVGEVGADAERDSRAALKTARDLDREREGKLVGEDERLALRFDAVLPVMRDHPLAPVERVARIVPHAVEELAEVHVEVTQEGVEAVRGGERDADVAALFLPPLIEGEDLGERRRGPSAWQACMYS